MYCVNSMRSSKGWLQGALWALAVTLWVLCEEACQVARVGYLAATDAMCSHVTARAAVAGIHITSTYMLAIEAMGGMPDNLMACILTVLAVYLLQQLQKFQPVASHLPLDFCSSWCPSNTCPLARPFEDDINGSQHSSQPDLGCSSTKPTKLCQVTAAATAADVDECQPCTPLRLSAAGSRHLSPCSSARSSCDNEDASSQLSGAEAAATRTTSDLMALAPPLTQASGMGGHTRQSSLLSELGRASVQTSIRAGLKSGSSVPSVLQQRDSLAQAPSGQQHVSSGGLSCVSTSTWSVGSHSDQNKRTHMEDRIFCHDLTSNPAFQGCKRAGLVAVADGHAGPEAAEYLEANLLPCGLSAGAELLRADPQQALQSAVQQAERGVVTSFLEAGCNAGSTLVAVLMVDHMIYVANVGDSRVVLGRGTEAIQLMRDHKPTCSVERMRIEADDPAAGISCEGYLCGELAVARGLGSAHFKTDLSKRALIATPDLTSLQLQAEDDFVVLASDGLWDEVDNAEVVSVASRSLASTRGVHAAAGDEASARAAAASHALVERAVKRCSQDNISVIVLHERPILLPRATAGYSSVRTHQPRALLQGRRAAPPCCGISTPAAATPCSGAAGQPHQHANAPGNNGPTPPPALSQLADIAVVQAAEASKAGGAGHAVTLLQALLQHQH